MLTQWEYKTLSVICGQHNMFTSDTLMKLDQNGELGWEVVHVSTPIRVNLEFPDVDDSCPYAVQLLLKRPKLGLPKE